MRIFSDTESSPAGEPQLADERQRVRANLASVKAIVALASAKGGVGKSILAVNIGATLAMAGRKVAIVDADLNSPSVPTMLGIKMPRRYPMTEGIEPAQGPLGIRVIATDLIPGGEPPPLSFIESDSPEPETNGIALAELGAARTLRQILGQARFGELDLVIIDLAPGVEELHRLSHACARFATILVSHPDHHAVEAARRFLRLSAESHVPIAAVIENMVGFNCDNCRSVRPLLPSGDLPALVKEYGLPVLARIAFDPRLAETVSRGTLFVREYADTPLVKQIGDVARQIETLVGAQAPQDSSPTAVPREF
ncbi:MAG: P-loop NTPase [Candidatus Binataceae bacterium]